MTFTVFTPTYNRAHTLPATYESLCRQTFRDFEWLIVDDGSSDNTEQLVQEWIQANIITIRYYKQINSGKHIAFNRGVKEAQGDLFVPLDSDDQCTPNALEIFYTTWLSIPENQRNKFSGVTCLCMNANGDIVGDRFPSDNMDMDIFTMTTRYNIKGEKWGFHRTKILKDYPFPEFKGEKFIPEGVVWNRIGKNYITRFINEPLRIYEYSPDGNTSNARKISVTSPLGVRLYFQECLSFELPFIKRLRITVSYFRFSFHSRIDVMKMLSEMNQNNIYAILMPLGWLLFLRDQFMRQYDGY
jgi:glycosyltransferase involved in cell wall biosynthesis